LYPGGVLTTPFSNLAGVSSPALARGNIKFSVNFAACSKISFARSGLISLYFSS